MSNVYYEGMYVKYDDEAGMWKVALAVRSPSRSRCIQIMDVVLDTGKTGLTLPSLENDEKPTNAFVTWEGKLCKIKNVRVDSTDVGRLGCAPLNTSMWPNAGGIYNFMFQSPQPQYHVGYVSRQRLMGMENVKTTRACKLVCNGIMFLGLEYNHLKLHDPVTGRWCAFHMSGKALFDTGSRSTKVLFETPERGFDDWDGMKLTLTDGSELEWGVKEGERHTILTTATFPEYPDVDCNMIWGTKMMQDCNFHFNLQTSVCELNIKSLF